MLTSLPRGDGSVPGSTTNLRMSLTQVTTKLICDVAGSFLDEVATGGDFIAQIEHEFTNPIQDCIETVSILYVS